MVVWASEYKRLIDSHQDRAVAFGFQRENVVDGQIARKFPFLKGVDEILI